jgi:hypothetical protein
MMLEENKFPGVEAVRPARIPRVLSKTKIRENYLTSVGFVVFVVVAGLAGGWHLAPLIFVSCYTYWRAWKLEQIRYTVENRLYCPLRDDPDEFNEYELQAVSDKPFCFSCNIPHFPGHCFDMD